jgi:hypothetical protein
MSKKHYVFPATFLSIPQLHPWFTSTCRCHNLFHACLLALHRFDRASRHEAGVVKAANLVADPAACVHFALQLPEGDGGRVVGVQALVHLWSLVVQQRDVAEPVKPCKVSEPLHNLAFVWLVRLLRASSWSCWR